MHPYCAVKLNIIKLGCRQGEGKEMGVVRDICSAQSSSPCSWGDLKREWGGWERSPQPCSSSCAWGEAPPCPWTWPERAWLLEASLWELLVLFPPWPAFICFVLSYSFLSWEDSSRCCWFIQVCNTKQVCSASAATSICALLYFFFPPFFLPCSAYSDSTEGGTGNFVFQNQFNRFWKAIFEYSIIHRQIWRAY